jgi:hypothetical protein
MRVEVPEAVTRPLTADVAREITATFVDEPSPRITACRQQPITTPGLRRGQPQEHPGRAVHHTRPAI